MLKSLLIAPHSRRAQRANAKRRAILRAAKAIFLKSGFGGATMDAVAARAAVSKMTVYRHFEDKEELFAGVITELCERIVEGNIEKLFEKTPEQALRGFARKMVSILFAPETVELHRIVVAECRRFPKLGLLFYESGPEASISALAEYFARNRQNPTSKSAIRADQRRNSSNFCEATRICGCCLVCKSRSPRESSPAAWTPPSRMSSRNARPYARGPSRRWRARVDSALRRGGAKAFQAGRQNAGQQSKHRQREEAAAERARRLTGVGEHVRSDDATERAETIDEGQCRPPPRRRREDRRHRPRTRRRSTKLRARQRRFR